MLIESLTLKRCKYYAIFLNSMAAIARAFDARIIKNVGDGLIWYFPQTSKANKNVDAFGKVLECCTAAIAAHPIINGMMH